MRKAAPWTRHTLISSGRCDVLVGNMTLRGDGGTCDGTGATDDTSESCRKPDLSNGSQQYQFQIENLLKTYSIQHMLCFHWDSEQQSALLFAQFNTC